MDKHITDSVLINDASLIKKIQSNSLKSEPTEESNVVTKLPDDNSNFFSKVNKKVSVIYLDRLTGGKDDFTGILRFDNKKGAFYIETIEEDNISNNIYLFTLQDFKIHEISE